MENQDLKTLIDKALEISSLYEYHGIGEYDRSGNFEVLGSILSAITKITGYTEMRMQYIFRDTSGMGTMAYEGTVNNKKFNLKMSEGKGLKFADSKNAKEYLENLVLYFKKKDKSETLKGKIGELEKSLKIDNK